MKFLLELKNINVYIGNVQILRNISISMRPGEVIALVGPNGAGKTTTLKSILGILPLRAGRIFFEDQDITHLSVVERVKKGIDYSPEDRRLIPDLTVEENILLPLWVSNFSERDIRGLLERIYEIIPEIKKFKDRKAGHLSGGQQKMVSIARALIRMPKLLLLDEPFEGLAPIMAKRFVDLFEQIKKMGISIIIAESNITYPREISDKIVRIERGEIIEVVENA